MAPDDESVTAILKRDVSSPIDGWCCGCIAGLVVELCPQDEPEYDTARRSYFLYVRLRRPVVALLPDGLFDYDSRRIFVLDEQADGTLRGEVAGFHAIATPELGGRWRLTLVDLERNAEPLSAEGVRERLHEEPGGDV